MINDLPTIHEVVTGVAKTQQKEKSRVSNQSKNKSKPNAKKTAVETRGKITKLQQEGETLCGACGEKYAEDEFWICCDNCETWFHGQCVKITQDKAEFIKQYKCPSCSSKRSRT